LDRLTSISPKRREPFQVFDAFTPDNDPYGEHDFGVVRIEDETGQMAIPEH